MDINEQNIEENDKKRMLNENGVQKIVNDYNSFKRKNSEIERMRDDLNASFPDRNFTYEEVKSILEANTLKICRDERSNLFDPTEQVESYDDAYTSYSTPEFCIIPTPVHQTTPLIDRAQNMFVGCEYMVTFPKFDTKNIYDARGMFQDCVRLRTIPELDFKKVVYADNMFLNCSNVKNCNPLIFNRLINTQNMFSGTANINIQTLGDSVLEDAGSMFSDSLNLKMGDSKLKINKSNANLNSMFANANVCLNGSYRNRLEITFVGDNDSMIDATSMFDGLTTYDTRLYTAPCTISIKGHGASLFYSTYMFASATIENFDSSVSEPLYINDMTELFGGDLYLLNTPALECSNVTWDKMEGAFYICEMIEYLRPLINLHNEGTNRFMVLDLSWCESLANMTDEQMEEFIENLGDCDILDDRGMIGIDTYYDGNIHPYLIQFESDEYQHRSGVIILDGLAETGSAYDRFMDYVDDFNSKGWEIISCHDHNTAYAYTEANSYYEQYLN